MIEYLTQNWDILSVGIVVSMIVIIGSVVYFSDKKSVSNRIFLGLAVFTSLWGIFNYLSYQSQFAIDTFFLLRLSIFSVSWLLYFFLAFSISFPNAKLKARKFLHKFLIIWTSLVSLSTLTPLVFKEVGELSVDGIILSIVEGPLLPVFGVTAVSYILIGTLVLIVKTIKAKKEQRRDFFLITAGVVFMFLSIMVTNFILPVILKDPSYTPIAALFIFPFIILTGYTITRSNLFNTKIIGTEIFIAALMLLALFQLMQASDLSTILQRGAVFIALLVVGVLLIREVMREVAQREELAVLNTNLHELLRQRESLVHLVTHKVKGAFTRSKYIFAGMLDGTFGEITEEIQKRAQQGLDSDNTGIETVDLVLNAANLSSGTIKYDIKPIDFKTIINESFEYKFQSAEKKGLKMTKSLPEKEVMINGDAFWIKEVVNNLLENSIRYTQKGSITVSLSTNDGKALLAVADTGVGITSEDKLNLFKEGGRGKDSVKVNVDSTGYGLYSVKLILDAHEGRVWAESAGPGQGSTFFVELAIISV